MGGDPLLSRYTPSHYILDKGLGPVSVVFRPGCTLIICQFYQYYL